MDSGTMVISSLSRERRENGWQLLEWMKEKNLRVSSMYWFFDADWTAWRLMIATPLVDSEGTSYVYRKIVSFVEENFTDEDDLFMDQIYISSPETIEVREMMRKYGNIPPDRRIIRRISEGDPYIYCSGQISTKIAAAA